MPGSFIDTNVLVYLTSDDPAKADQAERIAAAGGTISVQVLNELASVARRKMGLSWPETHTFLASVRALLQIPTEAGRGFRFDVGQRSDLKPATIPI